MNNTNNWLLDFASAAERADQFVGRADHAALLATGLMGEVGSVLAELKKEQRERDAYPAYRHKMLEEIGDFLWYFVRLVGVVAPDVLAQLKVESSAERSSTIALPLFLDLGAAVGDVLAAIRNGENASEQLQRVWRILVVVAQEAGVALDAAAERNIRKITSRWPTTRSYAPAFDDEFPDEEQLPRRLNIEFRERSSAAVVLRCNGINFGDRLTDNIEGQDDYRYHDIFHFAYAVHLGWSPVVRSLLRCKRKSRPKIDEGQDGARAAIVEEAVSAIAFARAKGLGFFDDKQRVDFDLLKTIKEFVEGYEVERIPFWQWEVAIIEGFSIFRLLRTNRGGSVLLDLPAHKLSYIAPIKPS